VRCSLVFLSSAQSKHQPSRSGRRSRRRAKVNAAVLDPWNGGSAPIRRATPKVLSGREPVRRQHTHDSGRGRSALSGRSHPMRTKLPGRVIEQLEGQPGGWRPGIRRLLAHNVGCATRALTRVSVDGWFTATS